MNTQHRLSEFVAAK